MSKRRPTSSEDLDILMKLMAIPGASGDEAHVAEFICNKLKAAGLGDAAIKVDAANQKTPLQGNVGNLIVKIPGTARASRRMLMSHMDTVPVCVGSQPKLYGKLIKSSDPETGLGADNRAGVAVTLLAALDILKNDRPCPPLTFLWTIQEEIGLHGARLVSLGSLGNPKLAFNWDGGSANKLTIGATGGYRMQIDIHGKATHAGNWPEKGISAIAIASLAVSDLQNNGWHGKIEKGKNRGTSNIGIIQGGNATNAVADLVTIKAEARSHDPVFRKQIVKKIEDAFRAAIKQVKSDEGETGHANFEGRLDYESFRLDANEPTVEAAKAAMTKLGLEPELAIANGGLDANWISARGLPTVSMGCGQLNAHMKTESLDIDEFKNACEVAKILATASEA